MPRPRKNPTQPPEAEKEQTFMQSIPPEDKAISASPATYDIEAAKQRVLAREESKQRNNAKSSSFCITAEKYLLFTKEIHNRRLAERGFKKKVWEDVDLLSNAIDDYIAFVLDIKLYPTAAGLCLWLDISMERYLAIQKSNDLRSIPLQKFKTFLDDFSAQNIVSTEGNPAGNMYLDKSRLGYTDQPTETTINIRAVPIQAISDANELAALVDSIPIEASYTEHE